MSGYSPPRWLERTLERILPKSLASQGTLGDLAEEFERRALRSPLFARIWYARQTLSIVTYRVLTGEGVTPNGNSDVLMDARWAVRSILKNPVFSFGIVAALGLGLGANAAVFSVVDGTFQNTSWWRSADSTVAVWPSRLVSAGELQIYSDNSKAYRAVGAWSEGAFSLRLPDGVSESVTGVILTPELFQELKVQPLLGRALTEDDGGFGAEPVAVLSEALWRRSFGADPGILGSRVDLNGQPTTIVGVQGKGGFAPGGLSEVWIPLNADPRGEDYFKERVYSLVGVLSAGFDLEAAGEEVLAHTAYLGKLFPVFYPAGWGADATVEWADAAQRRMVSTPLMLLLAGTGLLMLVTALNVGNLLLGRAIDRRRELAVRTALGAGRARIVRQLLVEGVVWTGLASMVGLATGSIAGKWIADLFVGEAIVVSSAVTEPTVLIFVASVGTLAWLVLSGVPVAHYLRSQRQGIEVKPASGSRMQRALVAGQAALATLLLVSATLLVSTVKNLRSVPLGFDPTGVLTVELSPPADRVADTIQARVLFDALVDRVERIPGVQVAGLTGWLPLRQAAQQTPINLESSPMMQAEASQVRKEMVDPGFFRALGVQPIDGRLLTRDDRADGGPTAVVVNETLAKQIWPDRSPIGLRIAVDPHEWDRWVPVVGVIPDIRSDDMMGATVPAIYVALAESPASSVTLLVRTTESDAIVPAVRRAVSDVDATVPVRSFFWMRDVVTAAYSTTWVMMGLLIVLAGLSTGLGAIGIYAVLAHHVALSKREIGVRMALGAQPGALVMGIVRSGLGLAGVGIVLGSVAAAVSTRFLESVLFGVSSLDPVAFVAPAIALFLAAGVAALVPAARAGRLPPAQVLRNE